MLCGGFSEEMCLDSLLMMDCCNNALAVIAAKELGLEMSMFDLATMNDVLVKATGRGDAVVMLGQDADGAWKPITSNELYGRVRALADVLRGWGLAKGDRVAILSENRWEWAVTDFATLAIGGVDVPLYPTLTPEQIGYMLRDSGAKVAVVSSREMYEKLRLPVSCRSWSMWW